MKKILALLITLSSFCFTANCMPTKPGNVMFGVESLQNASVNIYSSTAHGIERVEFVTECMPKKQAEKQYKKFLHILESSPRYESLNESNDQTLFIADGNIDNTVIVAKFKTAEGYRIVVAYDSYKSAQ